MRQAAIKREEGSNTLELVWYKRLANDSPISHRNVYKFDQEGKIIEEQYYSPESKQPERELFKYNRDGTEIEITIISSNGAIHSKLLFSQIKVDAKGNWVQRNVDRNGYKTIEFRKFTYYPSAK